ncbi:uncharacterized protein LOC126740584 isoform X2 [Anthonomus grandis grandis]|uniref:uncharacterized protein LOC126740584 isoform X2 n=1 Tax=Anthonomus grandis grandis TaxID=2921223 RepID=UPI00216515F0|nr:uncharacterized protein LOC126740584 isoform X2 [Anthonomus grandis grandis]
MKFWDKLLSKKDEKPGDIVSKLPKVKLPQLPKSFNLKLPTKIDMKTFTDFFGEFAKSLKNPPHRMSGDGKIRPGTPMKYPYTFTAKIVQFPYMYYYKNNWMAHYLPFGFIACLPIIWYIHKKMNSKENKEKWKEIHRKEHEYVKHRFDY